MYNIYIFTSINSMLTWTKNDFKRIKFISFYFPFQSKTFFFLDAVLQLSITKCLMRIRPTFFKNYLSLDGPKICLSSYLGSWQQQDYSWFRVLSGMSTMGQMIKELCRWHFTFAEWYFFMFFWGSVTVDLC